MQSILLAIIETKLTDNASIIVRNRNFDDWETLKTHLLDAYSEKRTTSQWQLELNSCRQSHNESVLSYSNKIETCYMKLINSIHTSLAVDERNIATNLIKNEALEVFLNGLNPQIALIVKSQKPITLENAISIAQQEEQNQKSRQEIQKYQQISSTNTKFCTYCNKAGHTSFNCRNKQNFRHNHNHNVRHINNFPKSNPGPSRQMNQNQNYSNNQTKFCNYCKNQGHLINECRKREFNNSRKQNKPNTNQNYQSRSNNQNLNSNSLNSTGSQSPSATLRTASFLQADYDQ